MRELCGDSVRETFPLFQEDDGGSIPTSPLQFNIIEINKDVFVYLNKKWHSRLPICTNCWDGICFGAEYKNKLYAVAWWSKPIAQNRLKDGKRVFELRRMAISDECPKNTASRFLKIMILKVKKKYPHINKLISYQDTDVHKGTIYKANNWTKVESQSKGFQTWKNRKNRNDLSKSKKVRWEYYIKSKKEYFISEVKIEKTYEQLNFF